MAVEDPLGVLNVDPALLDKIREVYAEIDRNSGNVATATAQMSTELKKVAAQLGLIHERNEEIIAAEKLIDGMYKRRAIANKDINELLSANKKIRDDELTTEKERLLQIEKNFKIATERDRLIRDEVKNRDELIKKAQKERDLEYSRVRILFNRGRMGKKQRTEALKAAGKKFSKQEKYLKGLDKEFSSNQKILRNTRRNLDAQADQVENREKMNKGMDTSVGFLDGMIEKTGFFSEKWKTGPLGGLTDFIDGGGDMSKLFDELKLKAGKINFKNLSANVLTAIIEQTIKFMLEFDKLASSLRKNTGIIDRGFGGMEQSIVNVQRANLRMGVSMDEAFASANALVSGMADFTSMSDNAQDKVLQVTAVMQEFGVSAQTTSEIFNTFSKGLGYNADELEQLGTQIMGIAKSLKVPPQIIATEFNAASKDLMKYGGDMIKVFEGLAEQSKQTGIAIGELMGIVKQYDTFEGAGEAVGKLNAILGGPYLNSINMLYATEEERVKMMRESIQLSGRQFKDLSRFEQQAIASAAGINDMATASKLFGGTSTEFANSRMEMKEMQERAAKAQATMDKFAQVMQSFAIALGPLITALGGVATAAIYLLNPIGELARLFGADADIISGIGTATVVGYGLVAMMYKGMIPGLALLNKHLGLLIIRGTAVSVTMGGIAAGILAAVAAGALMYNWVKDMSTPLAILTTVLVAAALAAAAYWTAQTIGVGSIPIVLGLAAVGAAVGGIAGTIEGFADGKKPGERVPGGRGLVGENGEEMVVTADGSTYRVDEPSVVQLGTQDTVLNNAETKAAMAGGAASGELLPVLASLQATLGAPYHSNKRSKTTTKHAKR